MSCIITVDRPVADSPKMGMPRFGGWLFIIDYCLCPRGDDATFLAWESPGNALSSGSSVLVSAVSRRVPAKPLASGGKPFRNNRILINYCVVQLWSLPRADVFPLSLWPAEESLIRIILIWLTIVYFCRLENFCTGTINLGYTKGIEESSA